MIWIIQRFTNNEEATVNIQEPTTIYETKTVRETRRLKFLLVNQI